MEFKAGQLVTITAPGCNNAACIVLDHVLDPPVVWYKVYIIEKQCTHHFGEHILSLMNPQEAESEV